MRKRSLASLARGHHLLGQNSRRVLAMGLNPSRLHGVPHRESALLLLERHAGPPGVEPCQVLSFRKELIGEGAPLHVNLS